MKEESPREMIARCERDGFTGSTTIHWRAGKPKKIDRSETWTPPADDGVVDISEVRGQTG